MAARGHAEDQGNRPRLFRAHLSRAHGCPRRVDLPELQLLTESAAGSRGDRPRRSCSTDSRCSTTDVCGSSVRATACKAPRHRWHLRQCWHRRICNLQNLKGPVGFESHPLRQHKLLIINGLLDPIFRLYLAPRFRPAFRAPNLSKTGGFPARRFRPHPLHHGRFRASSRPDSAGIRRGERRAHPRAAWPRSSALRQ